MSLKDHQPDKLIRTNTS